MAREHNSAKCYWCALGMCTRPGGKPGPLPRTQPVAVVREPETVRTTYLRDEEGRSTVQYAVIGGGRKIVANAHVPVEPSAIHYHGTLITQLDDGEISSHSFCPHKHATKQQAEVCPLPAITGRNQEHSVTGCGVC